jgi:hypothetical protein
VSKKSGWWLVFFFVGGREKGRLIETPKKSREEDLVEVLGR